MSRTKGSLNKPKQSNNVKVINLNKSIIGTADINDTTPYAWVNWGKNNLYPNEILTLYFNSITHHSCVDFIVNSIIGDGIDYESMNLNESENYPNLYDTWDELIRKLAFDLVLFGGYSFQIIKNKDNKTYSYYHQPFSTIRLGRKNDKGNIDKAYLSKDWSNIIKYKPIEIDIFNFIDEKNITTGKPYLFIYQSYNPYDEYYCYPHYIGAIEAIQAEIKMKRYDYNSIINNFTPSGIITFNRVADDEEKNIILNNVDAMFTDVENANNIIVTFRNSDDDKPVEFSPISAPVDGVNLFNDNNERTINRIISAHKIANKALIGLPMDSSGFSNEGTLLEAAYNLTNKILINNLRNQLVKYINRMFSMNGIETKIILKPLSFNITAVDKVEDVNVERDEIIDENNTNINN